MSAAKRRNLRVATTKCGVEATDKIQTWLNVLVIMGLQIPRSVSYSIVLPSLYQFVTAPRLNGTFNNNTQYNAADSSIRPGLGESDMFYSWAITMFSVSALVISPIAGVLPRFITYRLSILLFLLVFIVGSLLYAQAVEPWMILVARFLLGIFDGASPILLLSYASRSASIIVDARKNDLKEQETNKKFCLKDKLFAADLIHKGIIFPVTLGITSVVAQFVEVDQYRWPGWFLFALGILYTVTFLLVYREDEKIQCQCHEKLNGVESVTRWRGQVAVFKTIRCGSLLVILYFVYCGYVAFSIFNVSDTLLPPVLRDFFGFDISQNSIFFLVLMFVSLGAGVILISLKCFRMDNRVVLIVTILLGIIGTTLSSDWQAIGRDPCYEKFLANFSTVAESQITMVCRDFSTDNFASLCEAESSNEHNCIWNCISKVTGSSCQYCPPFCRSDEKSINFVQFSIGIVLIVICMQMFVTVTVSITTDVTPPALQGIAISAVYTANSVARTVTPLWIDFVYRHFNRHTYPPLIVINTTLLVALIGAIALYKQLAPRALSESQSKEVLNQIKMKELNSESEIKFVS